MYGYFNFKEQKFKAAQVQLLTFIAEGGRRKENTEKPTPLHPKFIPDLNTQK